MTMGCKKSVSVHMEHAGKVWHTSINRTILGIVITTYVYKE